MNTDTTHITPPRSTARAIASAVAGLLAIGLLVAGGVLLWGDAHKDRDGYLNAAREPFTTSSYALATDNLDADLRGAGWIMDRDIFGDIRIAAQPRADKPVFVGIARTSDVSAYLSGTPHAAVSDVSYSPFHVSYHEHPGDRRPTGPADQPFWTASAHGVGTQTVTSGVEDGDWSVVVMNEDASRHVDARISVGANAPFLATVGWASTGGGLLLLMIASALFCQPPSS